MKRHFSLLFAIVFLVAGTALAVDCSFVPNGSTSVSTPCINVGIGTSTPSPYAAIDVHGGATSDLWAGMGVEIQYGPGMTWGYGGATFGRSAGFLNVRPDAQATPPNPSLRFLTANAQRMMIDNSGVVRVADANGNWLTPQGDDRLIVNGTIRGANVVATYQDIAEWVPVTEQVSSGTVVIVDETPNTVKASMQPYDTRVAGVVSSQPGVILGVEGASKAKVATTGRVKVRVDASRHPIRVGDLLVTGERPGVAMVSEPIDVGGVKIHRPGTLIGKALESLERGEGEILVLLSLQ